MVMPLPARKYLCNQCGWSKTYPPCSDVLIPGINVPEGLKCPNCGNKELKMSTQDSSLLGNMLRSTFRQLR